MKREYVYISTNRNEHDTFSIVAAHHKTAHAARLSAANMTNGNYESPVPKNMYPIGTPIHDNPPWVIMLSGGSDKQGPWNYYDTFAQAMDNIKNAERQTGQQADIMKRLDDGTLTTEF